MEPQPTAAISSGPFDPDGVVWTPVSPRFAALRRTALAIEVVLTVTVLVVVGLVWPPAAVWVWAAAAVAVVLGVVRWMLIGPQVARWGYAERDDDLLVRHGLAFRSLVVVPYGRMQYVDVQAGPLDRAFGVAQVQLHTASAATDARIPGLTPEEAARLRDQLASRGQARLAGL